MNHNSSLHGVIFTMPFDPKWEIMIGQYVWKFDNKGWIIDIITGFTELQEKFGDGLHPCRRGGHQIMPAFQWYNIPIQYGGYK